ncbi:MAG: lysine--tRNA ligase [Candidatus Parvarchaeota archaeon]|nr:lysine--tRNA ligase [Candidatus Parvarchaeota archaeon]MCW1301677.1 lysine--tRNA ligase [Candidatus Parvarchaeota archaeon]
MAFKIDIKPDESKAKHLEEIKRLGVDPYGHKFERTNSIEEILENFDSMLGKDVAIAGRIIGRRNHGRLEFMDLSDQDSQIQLFINEDDLDETSEKILHLLDVGDIIGVSGKTIKTKTGEKSIAVRDIEILSKSLLPLPSRWFGIEDIEKRYRKRHLDFIMNQESRHKILMSSKVISSVRDTLNKNRFVDVPVPILQYIPGGGNATPFKTHFNALHRDFYLKIASELHLKRLLVGGFERVYDISKSFRNEGIDARHNPEFIELEVYQAYGDLNDMIKLTEEIVRNAAYAVNGKYILNFDKEEINLEKFNIIAMDEAVKKEVGDLDEKTMIKIAKSIDKKTVSYGDALNTLFEEKVQAKLIQPTFVTKYPIEVSPLAKKMEDDPRFVYRFELFIGGMEIANAFTELNDPLDQIERFKNEEKRKKRGIKETQEFDEEFIESLFYGMPPAGGMGMGLERLAMIVTNSKSIKEVIPFPQLREER